MLLPTTSPAALPVPSADALRLSDALTVVIRDEIARADGWIDFARYMDLALYAPGLGYYSAGSVKLGAAGDFITAPEISGCFGRALAVTLAAELVMVEADEVLELGAGSGALAAQLLDAFAALGQDVRYLILEPSADLRERQQTKLQRFGPRVTWLDELPAVPIRGAVVANEVLDALPVSRFIKVAGEARAVGVSCSDEGFRWGETRHAPMLTAAVESLERRLGTPLPDGYCAEISLALPAWLRAVAESVTRGCLLFVDYGFASRDYYHEQGAWLWRWSCRYPR
jgi:SAM-dependent MidA family methyltransferase